MMRSALFGSLLLTAGVVSPALAATTIPIPDSDFETFYKPGTSETVTGTFVSGWTNGLGSNV